VYVASSPEVAGVTGEYFVGCRSRSSSPVSYNEDAARRLWEVSEALTGMTSEAVPPAAMEATA
jgi:hypothetical protein